MPILYNNNNNNIPSAIPQWGSGEVRVYADLTTTLRGRGVVSDRRSAQQKAYQSRYYRKHDKACWGKRPLK
uniref:Putative ovule protein n=1 Tax=Solanum chacoense TaxID=4108 RepID=A0A0V0H3V3_SOLCH